MRPAYYDASYLFKLQCVELGTQEVRAHAGTVSWLVCSAHGRAEFVSSCHRKLREGAVTHAQLLALLAQMRSDTAKGVVRWLPVTDATLSCVENAFVKAPASVFLRAADALHLACAAENGFSEVYSNDRHFLAAAPLFGLRGINVIPSPRSE